VEATTPCFPVAMATTTPKRQERLGIFTREKKGVAGYS
jgi:hypothetical protein